MSYSIPPESWFKESAVIRYYNQSLKIPKNFNRINTHTELSSSYWFYVLFIFPLILMIYVSIKLVKYFKPPKIEKSPYYLEPVESEAKMNEDRVLEHSQCKLDETHLISK